MRNWTLVPRLAQVFGCSSTAWLLVTRIGAQLIGDLADLTAAPTYQALRGLSKDRCPAFDLYLNAADGAAGPVLRYRPHGRSDRQASVLLLALWDALLDAARADGSDSFFRGARTARATHAPTAKGVACNVLNLYLGTCMWPIAFTHDSARCSC